MNIKNLSTKMVRTVPGMNDMNMLYNSHLTKPKELNLILDEIFLKRSYSGNPLSLMLENTRGGTEEINNKTFEYKLLDRRTFPTFLMNEYDSPRGANGERFEVVFNHQNVRAGQILTTSSADKSIQIICQTDPVQTKDGWSSQAILVSDTPGKSIPLKYLKKGARWHMMYTSEYDSYMTFQGNLGIERYSEEITDLAYHEHLAIGIHYKDGKLEQKWLPYAIKKAIENSQRAREYKLFFSEKANIIGSTGRPVESFYGLDPIIRNHGWYENYHKLSAEKLEDFFNKIWYGRLGYNERPKVVGFTGTYGMDAFYKAMVDKLGKDNIRLNINLNNNSKDNLKIGMNFTEYYMPNGGSIRLVHLPMLDDGDFFAERSIINGNPLASQRFYFLDIVGGESQRNNITIMKRSKIDQTGFLAGTGGFAGHVPVHLAATLKWFKTSHFGLRVIDPTKLAMLELSE